MKITKKHIGQRVRLMLINDGWNFETTINLIDGLRFFHTISSLAPATALIRTAWRIVEMLK